MLTEPSSLKFLWLEITGQCNLSCEHCYASSSPQGTHGTMARENWQQVIADAAALGCQHIQFIGGEPTLSPFLPALIRQAHQLGIQIEIYSNLVSVRPALWELFAECGVRLATSFYSADPVIHQQITGGRGSFDRTVKNIKRVVDQGLPLRVGMVKIRPDQNVEGASRFLRNLGVRRIGSDRARGVGRGATLIQESPVSALCGKCIESRCAVTPSGEVFPCIMARSHLLGNVREQSLAEIIASPVMMQTKLELATEFRARRARMVECPPDECPPNDPLDCPPECDPKEWPPCRPDCCPETVADCEPSEPDDPD